MLRDSIGPVNNASPRAYSRAAPGASRAHLVLLAGVLVLACSTVLPLSAAEAAPLTNEDVVRMVMSGLEEDRILERIRSSPAAFDVAPGILEELRVAGVPERVIDAMVEKARSRTRDAPLPPAPESPGAAPAPGRIEVTFAVDPARERASNSVVSPAQVTWQEKEGDPEQILPARLAFVVACMEPTHAPDHWKTVTRLSDDVPRHHLLMLEESTKTIEGQERFVYLDFPAVWSAEVEPGLHRGGVGVVVKLGEQQVYRPLHVVAYEGLEVVSGEVTRMKIEMRSPGARRRTRRGFLKMTPGSGSGGTTMAAGRFADPRLRPTIKVLEITAPPSAQKPPEEAASPE